MNTLSKKQQLSLSISTQAESPDREYLLAMDGSRAHALAHAVKSVRLALTGEPSTDLLNTDTQTEEHLHLPNRWATKICGIKAHHNRWMDEDVHLHECVALGSWENR